MQFAPFLRGSAAVLALSVFAVGTASAQILWDNGPVVGANNLSVIRQGGTTFGAGVQANVPNLVADNFNVAGSAWNVSGFSFFSYQSFTNSLFTFTVVSWSIVSGDVDVGPTIASGSLAPTNGGLRGYRVTATTLTNTDRAIFQLDLDVPDFLLGTGNYWLRWGITGTAASGPWQPPTSNGAIGNARQKLVNDPFAQLIDAGDGLGMELPFLIRGTAATVVPEPSTWAMMLVGGVGLIGMARRRRMTE